MTGSKSEDQNSRERGGESCPGATNRKDMNGGYRTELQQQDLNKQKTLGQICFVRPLFGLPLAEPRDSEWNHSLKKAHWPEEQKIQSY